ncbi:CDP-diacylglycerol--glycerol-3-phosphate 3-phosphatidyltransferase (plasmid) [Tsukamurella tyrosinosolvens]|uniref:CDP-diacylglycerol--glycerol-3-phosphate 3-phosphatidyltransferase n=1 Tax=Tsukamurella tyrosinosolvens TaxID=57704 RepID=A0A1H4VZX9_TSUTY|nr:CDP-diacylglycerol--glycerol-3-phosphate 3-phosphatidyltransferase [Tsukamurella tyrosinosolvens]SEC86679.1 CDP-diacylglycerol--glycerol-3-phosphate 3-phosphatidyltransferase [Tsukamurella tyrosinosolvens]VEH90188.1 CDP-diacylglycerol--glycerol-3-phosphate 3-phosphatidyltransferase [Tsukamurella tyrosinosolvens]
MNETGGSAPEAGGAPSTPGAPPSPLNVPNALSVLRLLGVPLFLWLLLVEHSDAWALVVLMVSGFTDWLDGKLARLLDQQTRLGELLDPAADRLYMIAVPIAFGIRGILPWWVIGLLIGREVVLAGTVPFLRSRGITALPTLYLGKAATFALMYALPMLLAGTFDNTLGAVMHPLGWAFLIWGLGMYWWTLALYWWQTVLVVRDLPRVR